MRGGRITLAAVVALGILAGCSRVPASPYATDPATARMIVSAIYAGLVMPAKRLFHPDELRQLPDERVRAAGRLLSSRYGTVRRVSLVSTRDVVTYGAQRPGSAPEGAPKRIVSESIWRVEADKGVFEMELRFLERQNTGVAFRFVPSLQFKSPSLIASDQLRQDRNAATASR